MRPIQFNQDKLSWNWRRLEVSENVSHILHTVRTIKDKRSKWKHVKQRTAELLTEYYSILFNPQYRDWFWQPNGLNDLTLLFPTDEDIYISNDTNFILLPLPLPTYRQHVQWKSNGHNHFRLKFPCPFIVHTDTANELVHDMDYSKDNPWYSKQRTSDQRNINNWIQHTNPGLKKEWLTQTLDITARIRVYPFRDLFPSQAKSLSTYPYYNIGQRSEVPSNLINDSKIPELEQTPGMSEEEYRKRWLNFRNSFAKLAEYNMYEHRQYTLLEITPPNKNPRLMSQLQSQSQLQPINNKLQNYCKYLEPEQLKIDTFAKFFDFVRPDIKAIQNYFMDNMDWVEYSPAQIKSGIKRLKNIIKYKKPKKVISLNTAVPSQQDAPKFNQHVRSLNIKQADWSFQTQLMEDTNIIKRTSLEDTKPLYPNTISSWAQTQPELSSQQ